MSAQRFTYFVFAVSLVLLASSGALGQRGGTAAKGGSVARGGPEEPQAVNRKDQPWLYRPVIAKLGFDLSELEDLHKSARADGNPRLEFKTVIKAFIVAEMQSPSAAESKGREIVASLGVARNRLSRAVQSVYPRLTEEEAKAAERAANARYKQAEREAARPQR